MSKIERTKPVPETDAATTVQALAGDQFVPAEPDAVEWCRTFWRSMQDRLRRQARELERQAEHMDGIAARLNVWTARDFPWAHGARTAARLDAISLRAAAAICREGTAFARASLAELDAAPVESFIVPAEILERADTATERDGEWTGGDRLAADTLSAVRIPDCCRMAERRPDLGFPPTFELTDPDHEGAPDARLHSRFFRLDGAGDWPRVVEVTEDVQAALAGRRAARTADAQAAESRDRRRLAEAASATPLHHLRAKGAEGPVPFVREGGSGERRNTLDDSDGLVGAPAGEVRTPLQQLVAAQQIDCVQAAAGELFAQHFVTADFALGKGTDYALVRGGEMVAEKLPSTAAEEARHWVYGAVEALGGNASPMAMAVWSVAGAQMSAAAFSTSRHFRMPGGQRWLTDAEAENLLRQGLAALAAYLAAPTVEHQHRRRGLKVRVAGTVELSFLVGSRRFKVVATYEPATRSWTGVRMAPRKPRPGETGAVEFRQWCVKAVDVGQLADVSIATAVAQCRALMEDQERARRAVPSQAAVVPA